MALGQLKRKYDFSVGLFRRSGHINYFGPSSKLLEEVSAFNKENEGQKCIIIHSMWDQENKAGEKTGITRVNIGVYGNNLGECKEILNTFAQPPKPKKKA